MSDLVKQLVEEVILEKVISNISKNVLEKIRGDVLLDIKDTIKDGLRKQKKLEVTRGDIKDFISKTLGNSVDEKITKITSNIVEFSIESLTPVKENLEE
ncbi:MAG: hypothetical protein K0B02_02325 [DPANN group archaeon]|nr:hypothetical protein [DPANN group archaeon]